MLSLSFSTSIVVVAATQDASISSLLEEVSFVHEVDKLLFERRVKSAANLDSSDRCWGGVGEECWGGEV